jgi:hypothetical protein
MTTITPPYSDPGRASFEVMDTYLQNFLLAGLHPELKPAFSAPIPNNANYAQFTVVGRNAQGQLVRATWNATPASAIKPIGVLAHAATLGATGTGTGTFWYSGCFNIDALVWDATFDTDAKKLAAFEDSPTPTTIIAAKRGA